MTIVYTYGVFDLFHVGHSRLLQEARALGDTLIVGVFTDNVAAQFKRLPVIPFEQRIELVENHKSVDAALMQDEFSPLKNLATVSADIVCKGPGAGWSPDSHPELYQWNDRAIILPYHEGVSTSAIIDYVHNL